MVAIGVSLLGCAKGCLQPLKDGRYWWHSHRTIQAMSEEQLSALLAKIKDDAELQEKLQGAADIDAVVALAKEAGFDVSKSDLLKYQANQTLELSDEELERVSGGVDVTIDLCSAQGTCGTNRCSCRVEDCGGYYDPER